MSILFVLLTYIIIITVNYFWFRQPQMRAEAEAQVRAPNPVMKKEHGFQIPQGYCFHPGHTWAAREGREDVRVGFDGFAADLMGKIDTIDVVGPDRWVRQGQRLMTLRSGDVSIDLLSPIEGVVTTVNKNALSDPGLPARDPYKDGWIALIKAPDFATNQRNLMQHSMVAPWMHYSMSKLNASLPKGDAALAQDGGIPVSGVLTRVEPAVRQKLIKEFFLN